MEDKKKYEYTGTVTISTEEYRDLITDCATYKSEYEDYRSKYWTLESKVKDLESRLITADNEIGRLRAFIEKKKERRLAYKLFLADEEDDTEDEED